MTGRAGRYAVPIVVAAVLALAGLGACGDLDSAETSDASGITVPGGEETTETPTPPSNGSSGASETERVDTDGDGLNDALDLCPEIPGETDGCPDDDDDGMPDTTDITGGTSSPDSQGTSPPRMVEVDSAWYGRPAAEVVTELERLGVVAVTYDVCGDDVDAGEIREIMTDGGDVLLDSGGATEAGEQVEAGSVVEVRVGSGKPCG
jgi:hypothetical protein